MADHEKLVFVYKQLNSQQSRTGFYCMIVHIILIKYRQMYFALLFSRWFTVYK